MLRFLFSKVSGILSSSNIWLVILHISVANSAFANLNLLGYHLHSYLSAFFISAGVPNGEFPEILIAKCKSRFYFTWFFCLGDIVREINVSRAWDPVHAGDKALARETPTKRGRVNRYVLMMFYFHFAECYGSHEKKEVKCGCAESFSKSFSCEKPCLK